MEISNSSKVKALSDIFLFQGVGPDIISLYSDRCNLLSFNSGEIIHSSVRPSGGIGVLLSGKAKIVSGNGDTLLRILKTGDMFGAASVFAYGETNRTAVIAGSKCTILMINEDVINEVIETYPDAAKRYIGFLSERINFLNSKISTLTAGDAVSKTAGFLLSLDMDDSGKVMLGGSLTDMASKLNMGRASLYRTIDRFVADGIITRNKDEIVILDRDSLEDIIKKRSR